MTSPVAHAAPISRAKKQGAGWRSPDGVLPAGAPAGSDSSPASSLGDVNHERERYCAAWHGQRVRLARVLATRGRHADALAALEGVPAAALSADALCLKGKCLAGHGSRPQALEAFAGVLALEPGHVEALLCCAALYKDSGLLEEALAAVERAAAAAVGAADRSAGPDSGSSESSNQPTATAPQQAARQGPCGGSGSPASSSAPPHPSGEGGSLQQQAATAGSPVERTAGAAMAHVPAALPPEVAAAQAVIHTDLGTQKKLQGQDGWEEHYRVAVEACPTYAPAHYNRGVAAAERGDADAAAAHYRRATELEPRYAEAWCNLGVIHKSQGRLDEAVAAYERALAAAPNSEVVQANMAAALTEQGTALKAAGRVAEGVAAYERALALRPRQPEALYNLGVAFSELGQRDKAIFMYETVLAVSPGCAEAHNNLGVLHREAGNVERAVACYQAVLNVRPNFAQGLTNLAVIHTQQGRAQEAINLLQAAILAAPTYAEAYNNLGVLQRDVGLAQEALASYEKCLELDPDNRNAGQNRLLGLNYVHPGESELVCKAHVEWGRRFQQLHMPLPPLGLRDVDTTPGRPLVVGYISADLFTHSVSYFAEAVLRHHRPGRARAIVYSCVVREDEKTARLRAAVAAAGGTWRDVARLSEAELAAAVRADRVDVLVELTGHTALNRLGTMAMQPAPVTWVGYPNSTGLAAIDYRLTDAVADPRGTAQTFAEHLVRLPGCFVCYTPPADAPPVAPLPALANGFFTFGSFNALAKQTPEVLRVWSRILLAVPGSRLVLKNKPFACEAVRAQFWQLFEEEGIERSRVDLLPLAPSNPEHLAQYSLVDVSLDPWPYAGTTTTTESLFMGVPCLTLAGACHAHNVGVSLLTAVGLEARWVARSPDEYVSRAAQLAGDLPALAALRAGLRPRMLASRLCDGPAFVEGLEDAYQHMWRAWVEGVSLEGF
eukprot:scaffold27.g5978.t1